VDFVKHVQGQLSGLEEVRESMLPWNRCLLDRLLVSVHKSCTSYRLTGVPSGLMSEVSV
jgi:hypothetical protein